MSTYWGVDSSYYPADRAIKIQGRTCTVWEYVCNQASVLRTPAPASLGWKEAKLSPLTMANVPAVSAFPLGLQEQPRPANFSLELAGDRQPDFWGRYIGGRHQITVAEAKYIFESSGGKCRILIVYNGAGPLSVAGSERQGVRDAERAVLAATSVGVPAGVWIYCNIEGNWSPSANWFTGWWKGMLASPYGGRGGVYCKTTEPLFYRPYLAALAAENMTLLRILPGLGIGARYLWTTRPQNQSHRVIPGKVDFPFQPIEPPGLHGVTVIWQYSLDKLPPHPGSSGGMVDFDLANQTGFDTMWRAR